MQSNGQSTNQQSGLGQQIELREQPTVQEPQEDLKHAETLSQTDQLPKLIEQTTEQTKEQHTEQQIEQLIEQEIEQQIEQQTKQLTGQLTEHTKMPLQPTSQSLYQQPTTSLSYKALQLDTEKEIIVKYPIQESFVPLPQSIDESSTSTTTMTTQRENVDLLTKKVTIFHFNCLNLS